MGLFSKPDSAVNVPVTRERVEAVLRGKGWHYFVDSDGDVGGSWDGRQFYFFLMGERNEILQVRGRWNRTLPVQAQTQVALFLNDYNARKIWPKAYCRVADDHLAVYAEVSTDLEHGVADDQLDQLLVCGIYTGVQFFDALDERFPDVAAEAFDSLG